MNLKLHFILLLAFILFFPSLFNYFSHDDFFILYLSRIDSFADFLLFFNPLSAPERLGHYRPLTTQAYFLISHFFNLSPLPLHIVAYFFFFINIYLVYYLTRIILKQKYSAAISAFLYAVSATHFAHLYWPALFQELGLIFFFLLSVIFFIQKKFFLSIFALIGGLMSKETAIAVPGVLGLVVIYQKSWLLIKNIIPHAIIVAIFIYLRIFFYGLPPGDVYKLDFSPKVLNTLTWYVLWSFNLPELFVDFVGPAFHLNPNLLNFYGLESIMIITFFLITIITVLLAIKAKPKINFSIVLLCGGWFLFTLIPVIFLPWHKFTYNLGVPLVGTTIFLAYLFSPPANKITAKVLPVFYSAWLLTSVTTLYLTSQTHWITNGAKIAKRVYIYFQNYYGSSKIAFYDTPADSDLPWSPTEEIKINLSNKDFFEVYFPGKYQVFYLSQLPENPDPETTYIPARQFLGY